MAQTTVTLDAVQYNALKIALHSEWCRFENGNGTLLMTASERETVNEALKQLTISLRAIAWRGARWGSAEANAVIYCALAMRDALRQHDYDAALSTAYAMGIDLE